MRNVLNARQQAGRRREKRWRRMHHGMEQQIAGADMAVGGLKGLRFFLLLYRFLAALKDEEPSQFLFWVYHLNLSFECMRDFLKYLIVNLTF